jgi:hypothetical protein
MKLIDTDETILIVTGADLPAEINDPGVAPHRPGLTGPPNTPQAPASRTRGVSLRRQSFFEWRATLCRLQPPGFE